jgi:protein TonB
MPMFSACDSLTNYELRKPCADQALLKFIYERVKYPTISREGGVEGMVVVSFTIEKDGSLSRLRVVRDIGAGCGKEAMRVVNLFPNFEPAKIDGKPVRVEFNLPIRFRLE